MAFEITKDIFGTYLDMIGDGEAGLAAWEKSVLRDIPPRDGTAAMVFNANPFTNGHRYIAGLASRRSSRVIIFVIQGRPESGSRGNHESTGIELPPQDRLDLTRRCLADLENVTVLPSGPYLISRNDFPKGFLTEYLGSAPAHAVLDGMVFCHVCNALGIKSAFAGDEPRDELSEIHLNALRQECRKHGITLKVAERRRLGDRYISSAMVREALAENNFEEIAGLVPGQVVRYLTEKNPLSASCR